MSSTQANGAPVMTSIDRVVHIPIVECGMSSLHTKLSTTPLVRTAYSLSLSFSSRLQPYLSSASTHYPFAPVLSYSDRAANKTLDIAQEKWPYPFESKPEQVWSDVRSAAETRVVQPAVGVAKSVDQHLEPFVNSISFVVKKFDAEAESKASPSPEDYQLQRVYGLFRVVKDDIIRTANDEQKTIMENINGILKRLMNQSAALRSRSEGYASRIQSAAHAVLSELDKLSPLVYNLTSKTSSTLKEKATDIRGILSSDEPIGQKIPKLGVKIQEGIKDVFEDVVDKVRELVTVAPSDDSPTTSNHDNTKSGVKRAPRPNKNRKASTQNGAPESPSR